jgi:hypothetical protein
MKKFFPPALFFLSLFLSPLSFLGAENIKPFVMPSARAAGFGGIHAALGDDFSSIFSNPASFAGLERQFSAAEISISLYGPFFEILDELVNNSGSLDLTPIVDSDSFAAGFDVGGPIALGLVDNGFGFGIFNRSVMDAGSSGLTIFSAASEEIFLVGGYSFRILERDNHLLDLGFLGKGFYRGLAALSGSAADAMELFNNFSSSPYETQFGLGLDLGIRYTIAGNLTLALAGYDVYSPALVTGYQSVSDYGSNGSQSYATVTPRLAFGALYHIQSVVLDRYFSDFILMADYRDFIDLFFPRPRNPLLNLSVGMEITMLEVLRVRAGMAEALPSFGFGLDMKFLILDVAVRGRELGNEPGSQRVFALDLGLLFRY